jgi:uncharacterized protein YheU (UPF0270 family)
MIIPHDQLNPETLTALIEEFVTRDGALHGHAETPLERLIASVRQQLEGGAAVIVFDEASETASIVTRDSLHHRDPDEPAPEEERYHLTEDRAPEGERHRYAGDAAPADERHDYADAPSPEGEPNV